MCCGVRQDKSELKKVSLAFYFFILKEIVILKEFLKIIKDTRQETLFSFNIPMIKHI